MIRAMTLNILAVVKQPNDEGGFDYEGFQVEGVDDETREHYVPDDTTGKAIEVSKFVKAGIFVGFTDHNESMKDYLHPGRAKKRKFLKWAVERVT